MADLYETDFNWFDQRLLPFEGLGRKVVKSF